MYKFNMYAQLHEAEKRMRNAYRQITLLNERLENERQRYQKAYEENSRTWRYNLRMKVVIIEGMINVYYEYLCLKKVEIKDLRLKLFGEEVSDDDDDDEDGSDNDSNDAVIDAES